jgi:hypothetical protein
MANITNAIQSLRPTAQFVITDNNYSSIEWHELDGAAPTIAELEKEIARLKSLESKAATDRAEAKAALLERLGITADEAALLLA